LGLQSTFNFVVPFISASDFRFNSSSVSNALNSDGWISVWLMNPLTYPPSTPPTQQILMLLSAGSDFSYRLPISPGFAEGPVGEHPMDNAECGIVDDKDAGMFSGHSVGLPTPHTATSFFYDRYRFIGTVKSVINNSPGPVSIYDDNGKVKNLVDVFTTTNVLLPSSLLSLSPCASICGQPLSAFVYGQRASSKKTLRLCSGDDLLYRCCPFSYIKCDLEFTVVPPPNSTRDYTVHWYPPGATLDVGEMCSGNSAGSGRFDDNGLNTSTCLLSYNPSFQARAPAKVSAVIPFCLPVSLLPLY
ncbi:capsid protein VP1, partial [cosavirus A13]